MTDFYTHITNPIDLGACSSVSVFEFIYENPKTAVSTGLELEVRKSIVKDLSVVANASYIYSRVDASNLEGQIENRPLQGQSPYLINAGLYYSGKLFQANVLYNIIGERIYTVGDKFGNESILEAPRHQIDFNISKTFGKFEVKLGVNDLLNQPYRFVSDFDNSSTISTGDKDWRTFQTGTYCSMMLNYRF